VLQERLRAVYLHGSLALGCFNPRRSDIDVLVVVDETLTQEDKLRLVELLLHVSNTPHEIELDLVTAGQLAHWRHPSPSEFHYSEWSRDRFEADPARRLAELSRPNADLAAHVTVARAAGVAVVGPTPRDLIPEVPFDHLRDSLLRDLGWARDVESETYGILSPCRIWATLDTRDLHSKLTGARWALERLPAELKPPVEAALATYRDDATIRVDESARQRLFDYIVDKVR
jgi:streptomycin 3"-adenylyltransferase